MKNYIKFYFNCKFELLHRYVYDFVYQNNNADWGAYTAYKKANRGNKLEKYNSLIEKVYSFLMPHFKGWRKQIKEFSATKKAKFKRYETI